MSTFLLTALLASAFSSNIITAPSDTINGNDRLTYAIRMSDQSPIDEFGAILGGIKDTIPKPSGGPVVVSRSVHVYNETELDSKSILVLIDGKESPDGLSSVNSDNIQSIEVFKGSSAVEKYGDRAKNGAIIVYTKGHALIPGATYIVNGKEMTQEELKKMSPQQIKTITIKKKELEPGNLRAGNSSPTVVETSTTVTYDGSTLYPESEINIEAGNIGYGNFFLGQMLGSDVSEVDMISFLESLHNTHPRVVKATVESTVSGTVYCDWNVSYGGHDWNTAILIVSKDNILESVELDMFVPHNFNFVLSKEDSVNIIIDGLAGELKRLYGEPMNNYGATVWKSKDDVNIILSSYPVNEYTRTRIPEQRLEGIKQDGFIVTLVFTASQSE